MSLSVGTRVGPYEVLGIIGAGGMGEVYRAHDTNLHREVAIKVLPESLAQDPARLLRFEREARALAALNHPNIAAVYAIEGAAIVMELVVGEDLSARLTLGSVPIVEALPIARQVAEALAAAHEAGIVHRDLKPANIKVRDDGTVKVLDFGLAKDGRRAFATGDQVSASGSEDLPPTITINPDITRDGAVVGTAPYMAPEQARGKPIDKRADIWAFGTVLFEMLSGRRAFGTGDPSDIMARVLTADPPWAALPEETPTPIRRLLMRCLTKDRRERLHDIADARLDIDEAMAPRPFDEPLVAQPAATRRSRWTRQLLLGLAMLLIGLAAGRSVWKTAAPPLDTMTFAQLNIAPATEVDAGGIHPSVVLTAGGARTALAWSPDGRSLGFIGVKDGVRQIYIRELGSEVALPVAGTEGAGAFAFSPDGSEVAFWVTSSLRRVKIAGGPVATVASTGEINGIAWGLTTLIYSQGSLWSVDPAGVATEPKALALPPELVRVASPVLLPGEKALLYTEYEKQWTSGDERVMVLPLAPAAEARVLLPQAADARYLPTGHLVFLRQGTLFRVPFDAQRLVLQGEPVPLLKDVSQSSVAWDSADLTLQGQFAVSPQGSLAYIRSELASYPDRELVAIDRRGAITPLNAPIRGYRNRVEVSPDGTHLAVSVQTPTDLQLFSYDLIGGGLSRIAESTKGEIILGSWARDDRVAIGIVSGGRITAATVRPDGAAAPVPVADTTGFWPSSLTADGRLAGMKAGGIWVYRLDHGQSPVPFLSTGQAQVQPMWSPDGKWLAYTSNASGRNEVYVRPYPGPGEAIMISTDGGSSPAWNPNGRELFFVEPGPRDRLMSASVPSPGLPVKKTALFPLPDELVLGTGQSTPYAVAPGGQRFYATRQRARPVTHTTVIEVILNWFESSQQN